MGRCENVSIPSQPEGRELLQKPSGMIWIGRFNPLPARRPGATGASVLSVFHFSCFNPLPARRPGATVPDTSGLTSVGFQSPPSPKAGSYLVCVHQGCIVAVSIPSQPEGRELLGSPCQDMSVAGFNPLPARRPGATAGGGYCRAMRMRFNPLPARRPGATCRGITAIYSR